MLILCAALVSSCSGICLCTILSNAFRYFAEVMKHEELSSLSQSKFIELIASDSLNVEKEETVFEAVLAWLNHDTEARSEEFHQVIFNCIN